MSLLTIQVHTLLWTEKNMTKLSLENESLCWFIKKSHHSFACLYWCCLLCSYVCKVNVVLCDIWTATRLMNWNFCQIHHQQKGKSHLSVSAACDLERKSRHVTRVSNIPPGDQGRIFQLLYANATLVVEWFMTHSDTSTNKYTAKLRSCDPDGGGGGGTSNQILWVPTKQISSLDAWLWVVADVFTLIAAVCRCCCW